MSRPSKGIDFTDGVPFVFLYVTLKSSLKIIRIFSVPAFYHDVHYLLKSSKLPFQKREFYLVKELPS